MEHSRGGSMAAHRDGTERSEDHHRQLSKRVYRCHPRVAGFQQRNLHNGERGLLRTDSRDAIASAACRASEGRAVGKSNDEKHAMTPAELRAACDQAGGVYDLARMLGKRPKYLYRRINGESPISTMDELAIRQALYLAGE
jgi:hypothetical protein